jgi:hypothetical protein
MVEGDHAVSLQQTLGCQQSIDLRFVILVVHKQLPSGQRELAMLCDLH